MRRRDRALSVVLLCTLVLGLVVPAVTAEARPGGGSSSSAGRSSGGSSRSSSGASRSGGSSGGGGITPIIIPGGGGGSASRSATGGSAGDALIGFIVIVIVIIVLIVIIRSVSRRRRRPEYRSVLMDSLPPPTRAEEIERWDQTDSEIEARLADIQQRDPAFDRARFIDHVQTAYMILNSAWVQGDLRPALPFLSQGQAVRLQMQLDGDRQQYRRNVMENVVLSGVRIVRAEKNAQDDVLVARIDGSAADYYIDVRTGTTTYGWHDTRPYTEYWIFSRSATAKTTRSTYLERACPNCGAPLELGNITVCQFCGTPIASTEYDWVLMTIDQKFTNQ